MNIYKDYYELFLIENNEELVEKFLKLSFNDPVILRYKKIIESNIKET